MIGLYAKFLKNITFKIIVFINVSLEDRARVQYVSFWSWHWEKEKPWMNDISFRISKVFVWRISVKTVALDLIRVSQLTFTGWLCHSKHSQNVNPNIYSYFIHLHPSLFASSCLYRFRNKSISDHIVLWGQCYSASINYSNIQDSIKK